MSQQSRTALKTLMQQKVITGGRQTTAQKVRDLIDNFIDSAVNYLDDRDVATGYLGINASGIVNVGFIKKTSPTGQFLRDDGTWQTVSVPINAVNNGLSLSGSTAQLGGALVQNTTISGSFTLNVSLTEATFAGLRVRNLGGGYTHLNAAGTNGFLFNNFSDSTNLGRISDAGQILFGEISDSNYTNAAIGIKATQLTSNPTKEIFAVFYKANTNSDGLLVASKQGSVYLQPYTPNNGISQSLILGGRNNSPLETLILTAGGVAQFTQEIDSQGTTFGLGNTNATVINIGTGNTSKIINVGSQATGLDQINIYGTLMRQNVTDLAVKDKLVTYNVGGAAASGFDSGFEIEENAIITGYFTTNTARNGWKFKAPAITSVLTLSLASLSADRTLTAPNISGTIATIDGGQTFTSAVWQGTSISTTYTDAKIKGSVGATAGLIPYGTGTADTVTSSVNFYYTATDGVTAKSNGSGAATFYAEDISASGRPGYYQKNNAGLRAFCTLYGSGIVATQLGISTVSSLQFASVDAASMAIGSINNIALNVATNNTLRFVFNAAGGFTISEANDFAFGTTTGTKFGTATTQKIGFWNAAPIVQPTTGVAAATFVSVAGTALTDADTFDGYTLKQIVKALRNIGLLA